MSENKLRILVLCTGNSCRSRMAEGFFRYYGNDRLEVLSAGLEPKGLNPEAIQAMKDIGIDIFAHTSNHLSKYGGQSFDYVITVCDNAAKNCPVFPGAVTELHRSFNDPVEATESDREILKVFRRVRDEVDLTIKEWLLHSDALRH